MIRSLRLCGNRAVVAMASIAILALGFMPPAHAGVVSTTEQLAMNAMDSEKADLHKLLARDDVAERLALYGVSPDDVALRVDQLSEEELVEVQAAIGDGIAGGDALGIIGAVFLILLILELVGVTNVFSAI